MRQKGGTGHAETPIWVRPDRVLMSQLPVVLLLTVVATPLFKPHLAFIGSVCILAMALVEGYVCAWALKRPNKARAALAVASTFGTSAFYAFAALLVMAKKNPAANLFVIVLLSSSMIYVLLRYYQRPLAFLIGI